jgi:hypothetical protein
MQTRARTTAIISRPVNNPENLTYSIQDALGQLKEEVERVCAANARTETKVKSLMGYLDITKAGLLLSYVYLLFTILCEQGAITELKALETEVQKGFASLQSAIDANRSSTKDQKKQILDWESTIGLSGFITLYMS